jgi:hypothetical protein
MPLKILIWETKSFNAIASGMTSQEQDCHRDKSHLNRYFEGAVAMFMNTQKPFLIISHVTLGHRIHVKLVHCETECVCAVQ